MLGTGIIKGLYITAKNFVGTYFNPDERLTTLQYPEEAACIPENYRNFPFLIYDGSDPVEGLRCVACKMCENECPPRCISIVAERDEKGKILKRPRVFELDISVCMGCGICAEVCPFDSIKMDHHFEIATAERFDSLRLNLPQLAKSNEYFRKTHPIDALAVDTKRAEKANKAASKTQSPA
ncbi:MAG: 4Fe-4S dicluster domain-containing protein [Puniceicoccales bacterium]|jgi:NADH-quinone oxidoreductase subunit I|nr:4Fe-4S dicluster domain-containing protein [Puniceicoccales bacterium]